MHEAAWKQLFDKVLEDPRLTGQAQQGSFSAADYLDYVDGRPREDGVRSFLASRHVTLPDGKPGDAAGN